MYAGLTISDKPALESYREKGIDPCPMMLNGVLRLVDTYEALAQIAEMENTKKPLTWNERINWMTVEEKAWYFVYYHEQSNYEENRLGEVIEVATIGYKTSLAPEQYFYDEADAIAATVKILRSPYTEGATK